MGTWDELNNTYHVDVETDGIDEMINSLNEGELSDLFSDAVTALETMKTELTKGASDCIEEIGNLDRSFQEFYINSNASVVTGALLNSIDSTSLDDNTYEVGTLIEHFYPLCVEFGRGEVRPVNAKILHWVQDGKDVFSMYSSPSTPKPFAQPAFNDTVSRVDSVFEGMITDVTE